MEILNIGPGEFLLILVIALIVLGPQNMVRNGQKVGSFIRKVMRSSAWQQAIKLSQEIRQIPDHLIQDTGLEKDFQTLKESAQIDLGLDHLEPAVLPAFGNEFSPNPVAAEPDVPEFNPTDQS